MTASSHQNGTICVVGAGYVGLVTAACLAESGREVRLVEIDARRLEMIRRGEAPIYEPGLEELLGEVIAAGRLRATASIAEGMAGAGIAVIAVGTPPMADGSADLSAVRAAVSAVAAHATPDTVIVLKSTVPPGTAAALRKLALHSGVRIPVVSCPEFLREGSALADCRHPARVVVGGDSEAARDRVAGLFRHLQAPIQLTDATTAELIKYGSNAFLALKISFINEIARLSELTGADVEDVAEGIGADPRIGRAFLNAGLGFGGSCFPKDVRALDEVASYHGHSLWLLKAALEVNTQQRRRFVAKVVEALGGAVEGRRIALLGLAFKPGTDDMRQAPAVEIARHLQDLGALVVATDPAAMGNATALLPGVEMVDDAYACVRDADAIALVTEWPDFLAVDWRRVGRLVRRKLVIDGRNVLPGAYLASVGFSYLSMGRAAIRPRPAVRAASPLAAAS